MLAVLILRLSEAEKVQVVADEYGATAGANDFDDPMTEEEAAQAFGDVTNAMLVTLIDAAAATVDKSVSNGSISLPTPTPLCPLPLRIILPNSHTNHENIHNIYTCTLTL